MSAQPVQPALGRRDALWTLAATLVGAACQLLQLSVAAHQLSAQDFGALAIVNVMVAVINGVQDMGLSSYCVHLGEVNRRSQSTLFWISTVLGAVGATAVLAAAWPLAVFYRMDALLMLLPLLSLNFVLVGLSGQYQANFVRTFQARRLAQLELGARLASFALTLVLLLQGAGPAAVVIGLEVFWLLRLAAMAALAPARWHPTWAFDRGLARRALAYGGYQSAGGLIGQLRYQADQLILGRVLGPEALGLYSIAKELVGYPLRVMQPLIARLTLPVLAHHQQDRAALRAAFRRSLARTAALSAAVFVPFALLAPWVVELLYGPAFAAAAGLAALMALFGGLRPVAVNAGMLAQATGRTDAEFRWNLLSALIVLPPNLLIAALAPSLGAFAVALSLLQALLTVLIYPLFVRCVEPIGLRAHLGAWLLPGALMALAALAGGLGWPPLPPLGDLLG